MISDIEHCLVTKLQKGKPYELTEKRIKRINEALAFEAGTMQAPRKHLIQELRSGEAVYFLKPGKETVRKIPNPYDMTPLVGKEDIKPTFQDVWGYLLQVAIQDERMFKQIATLVYRVGYMLDHEPNRQGYIRYVPQVLMEKLIYELDAKIGRILPLSFLGFLHFIDLLGWNEDVKYHTENGRPTLSGKYNYKTGRPNTILSCISVPFMTWEYVKDILINKDDLSKFESKKIFDVMQRFARSRGVCLPNQAELFKWLDPYLVP